MHEEEAQARELEWLLENLQDTFQMVKQGLLQVASLIESPPEQASTLVLSTHRSEALKGFVTRVGDQITKGDMKLRLHTLPPPKGSNGPYQLVISGLPQAPPLILEQLTIVRESLGACLDVMDASSMGGNPNDANFVLGQLRLMNLNMEGARIALKGGEGRVPAWYDTKVDENVSEKEDEHAA